MTVPKKRGRKMPNPRRHYGTSSYYSSSTKTGIPVDWLSEAVLTKIGIPVEMRTEEPVRARFRKLCSPADLLPSPPARKWMQWTSLNVGAA